MGKNGEIKEPFSTTINLVLENLSMADFERSLEDINNHLRENGLFTIARMSFVAGLCKRDKSTLIVRKYW